ncbi:MAG TPA: hypothetical protein DCF45_05700 [Gammaproteobacteria bacterium]|nr:hypothetical protein [Gammaproteobacteria bacterium]
MNKRTGSLAAPLLLALGPAGAEAASDNNYQIAFVHDYKQSGDPRQLHRLRIPKPQLQPGGGLSRFVDDGGAVEWNALQYDTGSVDSLSWGRWTRGVTTGTGIHSGHDISGAEGVRNSFRYITGAIPEMALQDAATFSLLGGHTSPTAGEGGGTSITLINQGNLLIEEGGQSINIRVSLRVASGIYSFTAEKLPIVDYGFSTPAPVETSGVLCLAGCTTTIEGFIAGAQGQLAGIAFSVDNPALSKRINGIAAFKRD